MFGLRTKTINLINSVIQTTRVLNQKTSTILLKFDEKIKDTVVEKWVNYWKIVAKDYKDVAVELKSDIKNQPVKSFLIFSSLGFVTFCAKHNPDEQHFKNAFIKANNDVILIHPSTQRKETIEHLKFIEKAYNNNLIRYMNLGIFSFVWVDTFSNNCHLFEAHCPYLQLEYTKIPSRIIDFGFWDTWWILTKKMTDYDINY